MKIIIFLLIICSCLFPFSAYSSVNCTDVEEIDNANGLARSLSYLVGCKAVSADILSKEWNNFPEHAQVLLSRYYLVPGSSLMNWNDPRLNELIGNGSTLIQRLLALEYSLDAPEMMELWESLSLSEGKKSEFENAYFGMMYYFHHFMGSEVIPIWSPSPANISILLESSDVPLFRISYAAMMEFGDWVVGSEDEFISIYDAYVDVLPEAAFFKAHYYLTNIYDGNIEYRQYIAEIINLLESSKERGFTYATEYLADIYNEGSIVEMNEKLASQIYQKLALFGWADMQIRFGEQLLYGYGVKENISAGWDWIERGAGAYNRLSARGYDLLYEKSIEEADYLSAIHWAFQNARHGYISYAEKGYYAVKALLANLSLSEKELGRLYEYLRYHCETNTRVTSISDCQKLAKKSAIFSTSPEIIEVLNNPSSLRLSNEISLNAGKFVALIISNDSYKFWDTLKTPQHDADLIGNILESDYGFEVHYLQNSSRRDTLRAIYDIGSNLEFEDHFLLYYAGHGIVDSVTDAAYWIPSDASRDFRPDWISSAEIMTSLKVIPSRHLLLVADSCYSGKLLRGAAPTENSPNAAIVQRLFSKKARVAITSGGDEPVQDSVSGNKNSIFATALANALRETDKPTPSSSIFNEVLSTVALEVSQTPQYADMRELGHDGGDFIFIPTYK